MTEREDGPLTRDPPEPPGTPDLPDLDVDPAQFMEPVEREARRRARDDFEPPE